MRGQGVVCFRPIFSHSRQAGFNIFVVHLDLIANPSNPINASP